MPWEPFNNVLGRAAAPRWSGERYDKVKTIEPLKITDPILAIEHLHLYYGNKEALRNISLAIPRKRVTAFIVPQGAENRPCCAASTA